MKKKKIWLIVILLLLIIISIILIIWRRNFSENAQKFYGLIKYKTQNIYDSKVDKLLKKINWGDYIIDIRKDTINGKEQLTVYYDCTNEDEILEYYRNINKNTLVEENSLILFTLVNDLDKLIMNFNISNTNFVIEHHLQNLNNKFDQKEYSFTREQMEKNYNRDVREYIKKPQEFMQYNIDLNVEKITLYYIDDLFKFHSINLEDKDTVSTILHYIETQNFKIIDSGYLGMAHAWVDLNNGYIIGIYGNDYDNFGDIIQGKGDEIFNSENPFLYLNLNSIHKLLPDGLTEYVEKIISENVS